MLAVSSAWLKLSATKLMAPRLYTSSGCDELERRHQRRQVGEVAGDHLDERHLLEHAAIARVALALHHPEHVVALAVQELGQVLAVLASDPGDERASASRWTPRVGESGPGESTDGRATGATPLP